MTALVFNVLIVVGWLVWSFLFWRSLRHEAVEEDRIFDLTFYSTLVAFIVSRLGFVVTHGDLFWGKSPLLVGALWVAPGLSWLAGLIGGVATLTFLSRRYHVRLGLILDALALSLPPALVLGETGAFAAFYIIGRQTNLPWAIRMGNDAIARHPVSLYVILGIILVSIVVYRLGRVSSVRKWPYGIVGVWFFLLYSVSMFALEFVKDSRVYWGYLTANQWMLIGIFAESVGVLYVRGGGRERLRPVARKLYEFISKRYARWHTKAS